MIKTIHRLSTYFFLPLLGIYTINKLGIMLRWWGGSMTFLDKMIIVPLGFITIVYIFTGIKEELNRLHIHNLLYDILLVSFFVVFIGLFVFIRFMVTP